MELKVATERAGRRGEAGFSLIEGLVAAVIVLVVALSLIPLVASSMRNTAAGRDYSVASQFGRSQVDELNDVPFYDDDVVVPAGQTVVEREAYWDPDSHRWTGSPSTSPSAWGRTTTLRQYNVNDLVTSGRLVDPLDGGAPAPQVHLREVIVEVETTRGGGPLGSGREVRMTLLRGF